jgi:hypothetical protein
MRANIGRAELKRGFIELGSSRGTGRSALANCVSGNQATSGITGFQFRGPPAERRARRPQPPAETGHAESPLVKLVGSIFIGAPGIPGGLNAAPTNIYFSCFARARARGKTEHRRRFIRLYRRINRYSRRRYFTAVATIRGLDGSSILSRRSPNLFGISRNARACGGACYTLIAAKSDATRDNDRSKRHFARGRRYDHSLPQR